MQFDVDHVAADRCHTPRRAPSFTNMPDHFSPVTDSMSPDLHTLAFVALLSSYRSLRQSNDSSLLVNIRQAY